VKHIPEPNFTIDREGKDTWRYAQAGATTVVGVSADEIATIEKGSKTTSH
jgi:molybdopterin-guanine dinucleotide biosynthesis protein MobB